MLFSEPTVVCFCFELDLHKVYVFDTDDRIHAMLTRMECSSWPCFSKLSTLVGVLTHSSLKRNRAQNTNRRPCTRLACAAPCVACCWRMSSCFGTSVSKGGAEHSSKIGSGAQLKIAPAPVPLRIVGPCPKRQVAEVVQRSCGIMIFGNCKMRELPLPSNLRIEIVSSNGWRLACAPVWRMKRIVGLVQV